MKRILFTLIIGLMVVEGYTQSKPTAEYICRLPLRTALSEDSVKITGTTLTPQSDKNANAINLRSCGIPSTIGAREPLYVVDGEAVEAKVFQQIDPNDFETIEVLKDCATTALIGCRGSNGVIIATTKKGYVTVRVVDSLNGSPIPHATVTVAARKGQQDEVLTADSTGTLRIGKSKLANQPTIVVSSVSYISKQFTASNVKSYPVIKLQRKMQVGEEAVVTGIGITRICRFLSCRSRGVPASTIDLAKALPPVTNFKAYPNPVKAGQSATVEITVPEGGAGNLQLVSLQGQVVQQWRVNGDEGVRTLQAPVNGNCAPGMYMLVYKNQTGKVLNTTKLVIQ